MNHLAFVRSLSPDEKKYLTARSNLPGLVALTVHAGAILVLGGLILSSFPAWPLLMVAQGILIVFLFTLLHETIHRTAFRSRWLNVFASYVAGFAILLPPGWFRHFHFAHHRHTQDPENDPELAEKKPETLGRYILHVSGLPVWISHGRTLVGNALGRADDPFLPNAARDHVRRESQAMLGGYALVIAASAALGDASLVHVWLLPALLGQPFLRLYLLAEHGRCPHVANMFENTRTTFTTWLVRKLAWNMPFHAEHHAFPAVPFHRLPALHRLVRAHLKVTEHGYGRFHQKYLADLRA